MYLYIGNMSSDPATAGVHVCRFEDGRLRLLDVAPQARPSFLALSARRRLLFAASHVPVTHGIPGGSVAAYAIGRDGRVQALGTAMLPLTHPAFVRLDPSERFVLTACTMGGGVAVLPVSESGALGAPVSVRMHPGHPLIPLGDTVSPLKGKGMAVPPGYSMPHSIGTDPSGRVAVAPDKADRIMLYAFDGAGGLEPVQQLDCPGGSGPRHHVFHRHRPLLFVLNENDATVSVLSCEAEAQRIEHLAAVSTLPEEASGPNLCAEVVLSAGGRFLYCSNRGHDSIAQFRVTEAEPYLVPVGWSASGGREPRHIAISPGGKWMFASNVASDEVCGFRIDPETGRLAPDPEVRLSVPAPSCVAMLA